MGRKRSARAASVLLLMLILALFPGCGLSGMLSQLQGSGGAEGPEPSEYVHFNLIGSESPAPEPGGSPAPTAAPLAFPTLEEALAGDSWGLLYPHPREKYVGREYYSVSDEKDLIRCVADGLDRGIRGIVLQYDSRDYNYWLKTFDDNCNRSEFCGHVGGSYTVIREDDGSLGIYPIFNEAWQAFTYYRYLEPEISDETMELLRAAYDLAVEALQKYPGDEYGVLLYVNDRLAAMAEFADPAPSGLGIPERDATGVFFKGRAVCAGYTAAYRLVLNILGIENKVIRNRVSDDNAAHIWNYVQYGGQWYHVDVTWNRSDVPEYRDEYFLLTDGEMAEKNGDSSTHSWIPFVS